MKLFLQLERQINRHNKDIFRLLYLVYQLDILESENNLRN